METKCHIPDLAQTFAMVLANHPTGIKGQYDNKWDQAVTSCHAYITDIQTKTDKKKP